VTRRQPVADALPRHSEPGGDIALVAELAVRGDRLPLFGGAGADERIDEATEGGEQHVTGLAGAEVAGKAVVAGRELQGLGGEGVCVVLAARRFAQTFEGADADADPQPQWCERLAQDADAERSLGGVAQDAVDAPLPGDRERLRDRRGEEVVDALDGEAEAAAASASPSSR